MSVISHFHTMKNGVEELANIYSSVNECPEPNLKVWVNNTIGYIKLGDVNDYYATKCRIHRDNDNKDYAVLSQHRVRDFPNEWGAFKYLNAMTGIDENSDMVYVWSMHFENATCPIVIQGNTITYDADNHITDTSADWNSFCYSLPDKKWLNCHATNDDSMMTWCIRNPSDASKWHAINAISYTTATIKHWNRGYNVVEADNYFTYGVSGDQLTIYRAGQVFKTYTI